MLGGKVLPAVIWYSVKESTEFLKSCLVLLIFCLLIILATKQEVSKISPIHLNPLINHMPHEELQYGEGGGRGVHVWERM